MAKESEAVQRANALLRRAQGQSSKQPPPSPPQQARPMGAKPVEQTNAVSNATASPPMQARPQGATPVNAENVNQHAGMMVTAESPSEAALPMNNVNTDRSIAPEEENLSEATSEALALVRKAQKRGRGGTTEIPRYLDRRAVQQNAILNLANGAFLDVPESALEKPKSIRRLDREGSNVELRQLAEISTGGQVSPEQSEATKYLRERAAMRAQNLNDMLAVALQVPRDEVDVTSGLGDPKVRALMGTRRSFDEKIGDLRDAYGEDNVKYLNVNGGRSALVRRGGKWRLVDEYGASFGDVLDVSRQAIVAGAEVAASAVPSFAAPRLAARAPVTIQSISAGLGALAGESFMNYQFGGPKTEGNFLQSIVEGGLPALRATGFDFTAGVFAKGAAKVTRKGAPETLFRAEDVNEAEMYKALDDLGEKFGVDLTGGTTQGMRASLRAADREAKLENYNATGRLARRRQAFRQTVADIRKTLQGGAEEVDADTVLQSYRSNLARIVREDNAAIAQGDRVIRETLDRAAEKRLQNLGYTPADPEEVGSNLRQTVRNIDESTKTQTDQLYSEVQRRADEFNVGINKTEYRRRVLAVVNSLDLPRDQEEAVIQVFLPRSARRARKEAQAVAKTADEAAEDQGVVLLDQFGNAIQDSPVLLPEGDDFITFNQLVELKKEYGRLYGALRRQGVEKASLSKLLNEFDSILSDTSQRAGAGVKELLDEANQTWRQVRAPILQDDGIQKILSVSVDGKTSSIDDSAVTSILLGKRADRMTRLRKIRQSLPEGESRNVFDRQLRESYLSLFLNRSITADGEVPIAGINQMLKDKEMVDFVFGPSGSSSLRMIRDIRTGAQNPSDFTVSVPNLLAVARAQTAQERREAITAVRQNILLNNRQASLVADHIRKQTQSSTNIVLDAPLIMEGIDRLKPSELEKMMELLPDDASRETLKQSFIAKIFSDASTGVDPFDSSSRMLWDPVKLQERLNKQSFRNRIIAVAGEEGLKHIQQLNILMRRGMRVTTAEAGGVIDPRVVATPGSGLSIYTAEGLQGYLFKALSIGAGSETFSSIITKSRTIDDAMQKYMPALIGTTRGIEGIAYENEKDPRFRLWVRGLARTTREQALETAQRGQVPLR